MTTASLPQVKSISMRESVGDVIRKALYDGRFEPGQSLSEAGLAAEMQISRGPVREALLMLAQEGLVTHSPNRGFSVVQISAEDMNEIQQVRMPLEAMALKMAQPKFTSADLAVLEELKKRMVEEYLRLNLRECAQLDMAFHSRIWERAGNARLSATLSTLLAPFFAYGSLFNSHGSLFNSHRRPDLTAQLIAEEHGLLIQFLKGLAESSAEECMRFHLGM
jgi:DNA-binding GntR family transcriptional regulator